MGSNHRSVSADLGLANRPLTTRATLHLAPAEGLEPSRCFRTAWFSGPGTYHWCTPAYLILMRLVAVASPLCPPWEVAPSFPLPPCGGGGGPAPTILTRRPGERGQGGGPARLHAPCIGGPPETTICGMYALHIARLIMQSPETIAALVLFLLLYSAESLFC